MEGAWLARRVHAMTEVLVWNVNFEARSGLGTKLVQRKSGRVCGEDDCALIYDTRKVGFAG